MYGNYDILGKVFEFDFYLGVNFWDFVKIDNVIMIIIKEIIYIFCLDYVYVCFVDKNKGILFLFVLEFRFLKSGIYDIFYDLLMLFKRWDFGGFGNVFVR